MVSHLSLIKIVKKEGLYLDKLPRKTKLAFLALVGLPFLSKSDWYLAGGTGLGLQAGHRQSVDLDFFTPETKINLTDIERELLPTGRWKTSFREKGTMYGTFAEAKISFISYPFFLPSPNRLKFGQIKMILPSDIAAMKIIAISQRGRKRDFVDLYWYLKNKEGLSEIIRRAIKQYPGQENNLSHILKSLVYFDDAQSEPMPKLYFKANWREIKSYFKKEVAKTTKELLIRTG